MVWATERDMMTSGRAIAAATIGAAAGLCFAEDGGDAGGGGGGGPGGAAAALAGGGAGDGGGDDAAAAAAAAATSGGGGDAPDYSWATGVSAEAAGEGKASNLEWLQTSGVKDMDGLVKVARDNQAALRDSGRIKVPGEGATEAEIAEYHKAIGVPDNADGYEFELPEGVKLEDLDQDMLTPMKEIALKAGVPKGGYAALAKGFIEWQQGLLAAEQSEENADYDNWKKAQGKELPAREAEIQAGLRALGLKPEDFTAVQRGFRLQYGEAGSSRASNLFQKIGAGAGEHMLTGDGKQRFGLTAAEAQRNVDAAILDPKWDPVNNGEHKAKWALWNQVIAADRERKQASAAAG